MRLQPKLVKKLLAKTALSPRPTEAEFRHMLMLEEAKIGGQLFGEVSANHRRDFLRMSPTTWVWNEGTNDPNRPIVTTRFEVQPDKIIKIQDNQPHQILRGQELTHFHQAVRAYARAVRSLYATLAK